MLQILAFVSLFLFQGSAFSIPGVSLSNYQDGDKIEIYANELTSIKTQLNFEHYFLKFCKPEKQVDRPNESLGSILLGESSQYTTYNLKLNKNETCTHLCTMELEKSDVENFMWMIEREYNVNLVLDNLPSLYHKNENSTHPGFPIGRKESDDTFYIYNHLSFRIDVYHETNTTRRVVGFSVIPRSIAPRIQDNEKGVPEEVGYCQANTKAPGNEAKLPSKDKGGKVYFSYDVQYFQSSKAVATRWDEYKSLGDEEIHWFSILNSFVINVFLTTLIGCILKKTVGSDIRMYNELRTSEDIQEDRGWKQLSRDVFRPPKHALLLSVLVGTGVQVASMFFLTLLVAALGFMDQEKRGSLLTTVLLFYTFMGIFAGYYSARVYKMYNGPHWIKCTLATALLYPSINFAIFYVINFVTLFEGSSNAFHTTTILALFGLWFGISIPLVFLGSLVGYKKQTIQNPCKYNPIPKFVKPQPWYLNKNLLCVLGGLLPFGSIFIELHFIMTSVWHQSFYYLFSFLFGVLIILIVTSAEISIVITYLQLCNGNHRIWWRSFFNTGSIAIYLIAYSIFYYFRDLSNMKRFSSILLYFGYMAAMSITLCIFCGMIGFLASYWFVRQIYSSIRID